MKILNENEIIHKKQILIFVESSKQNLPANDCLNCCFQINQELVDYCEKIPCSSQMRSDGKNGWFEIKCNVSNSTSNLPF